MQCFTYPLLFLGFICLPKVSCQDASTAEAKNGIANKLSEVLKPKVPNVVAGRSGLAVSKSAMPRTNYIDLMLIIDSGRSIGASNFEAAKMSTISSVDQVNSRAVVSPTGSRVALIKFSSPSLTQLVFGFGDHQNAYAVKNQIRNLHYDNGPSSVITPALLVAIKEFQNNPSANAQVIWIFTDGISSIGGNPVIVANQLKAMGVTICSVAVGWAVNRAQITAISSPGCVYFARSLSAYNQNGVVSQTTEARAPVLDPTLFNGIKF